MTTVSTFDKYLRHSKAGGTRADFDSNVPDEPPEEMGYARELVSNIPGSTVNLLQDLVYPFIEPEQTAKSIKDLGVGVYSLITDGDAPEEATALAVGEYFADRYGSAEAFSNSLKTDPVGVVSDIAGVFTGGATIAGKTAAKSAKIAAKLDQPKIAAKIDKLATGLEAASEVASKVDPAAITARVATQNVGTKLAKKGLEAAVPEIVGRFSGVGADAYREGFRAARAGGAESDAFFGGLRSPDVVSTADQALENLTRFKSAAQATYNRNKAALNLEGIETDWGPARKLIQQSRKDLNLTNRPNRRKGSLTDEAKNEINEIYKDINRSIGNPLDRNMAGVDEALQRLNSSYGNLKDPASRKFHQQMKQTLKQMMRDKIGDKYDSVLEPYHEALQVVDQFGTELKARPDMNPNQIYRGLIRSLRSNVNTNFGQTADLLQQLDDANPSSNLMASIAGQSLNPAVPTTLNAILPVGLSAGVGVSTLNPAAAGLAMIGSPRITGEVTGLLGRAARGADRAAPFVPSASAAAQLARPTGILGQIGEEQSQDLQNPELMNYLKTQGIR